MLYSDGGSRGNPGPAAIGGVLYDPSNAVIATFSEYIGMHTNNQAEYYALIRGLNVALQHGVVRLQCLLDSELVVRQLQFEYKVKDRQLAELFANVVVLMSRFESISFHHIPREKNTRADALVNEALDSQ